jgi:peptidoglycan/xylan/chitin deacetylase (PgdA/CDA1 family)
VTRIPVLLYHSISLSPPPVIAPFTVTPSDFERQLDLVVSGGFSVLTVSAFADALTGRDSLPPRPLVITFDDGFADFYDTALPALRERALRATLYVPTALLRGSPERVRLRSLGDALLEWSQLRPLHEAGVEIGAHSHTHPHLDTLSAAAARDEILRSKALLEDELGTEVDTFAYPNGYSGPRVRRLVAQAGFRSACAVKNAFSSPGDDVFAIARLTLTATTSLSTFREWLAGSGAPDAPARERLQTRVWRAYRRARSIALARPGSDF